MMINHISIGAPKGSSLQGSQRTARQLRLRLQGICLYGWKILHILVMTNLAMEKLWFSMGFNQQK